MRKFIGKPLTFWVLRCTKPDCTCRGYVATGGYDERPATYPTRKAARWAKVQGHHEGFKPVKLVER